MAKQFVPKIITSNHLIEGDSIYLTADNCWSRHFADAMLLDTEDAATSALQIANGQSDIHVGAYLADAHTDSDTLRPTHFREAFRATGPSNYFHGKQAV